MSLTLQLIAVLHVRLPVAGLPLDVERETRRASHRRQPGHTDLGGFVAPRVHSHIEKSFATRAISRAEPAREVEAREQGWEITSYS